MKKITLEECTSFFLDKDNEFLYPNIWNMLKFYYDAEFKDQSQYMIEHKANDDVSVFEITAKGGK